MTIEVRQLEVLQSDNKTILQVIHRIPPLGTRARDIWVCIYRSGFRE